MSSLPPVRGKYRENALLADTIWFRAGGAAEVLYKPADVDDLADFMRNKPKDVPVMVLGVGSNIIVRDGGIEGVVIRLGRGFVGMAVSRGETAQAATPHLTSPRKQGEERVPSPVHGGRLGWGAFTSRKPEILANARELRKNATNAEKLLWSILRMKQLEGHKFRRQYSVGNYITDFACLEKQLIIELDGGQHDAQQAYDKKRDAFLNDAGFTVLRFWNNEVMENIEGVVEVILGALEAPHLTSPRKQGEERVPSPVHGGGLGWGGAHALSEQNFSCERREEWYLTAGAANLDVNVAEYAAQQGMTGLEFLIGIPGTIGGALAMNAGAYGTEIKDVLIRAQAVSQNGDVRFFDVNELNYTYRHCGLEEGWVFTEATFHVKRGNPEEIRKRMDEISTARQSTQPVRARTGGSTFKNPPSAKAWELIDAAGGRGMMLGKAQVSEKHCNFLINTGDATASDIEALGEAVREKVKAHSGILLEWEIKRIGKK